MDLSTFTEDQLVELMPKVMQRIIDIRMYKRCDSKLQNIEQLLEQIENLQVYRYHTGSKLFELLSDLQPLLHDVDMHIIFVREDYSHNIEYYHDIYDNLPFDLIHKLANVTEFFKMFPNIVYLYSRTLRMIKQHAIIYNALQIIKK